MERATETTPRPHHGDPKPDRTFRHAVTVTSAALAAAVQTGIKDGFAASHRSCHIICDDTIKADTTQAAIRAAVPACAPHRAASLLLRNRCAGGSDMTKTDTGRSRESGAGAGPGRGRKRGDAARAATGLLPPPLRRAQAGRGSMAPPPLRLGGRPDVAVGAAGPLTAYRRSEAPPHASGCGPYGTDPCITPMNNGIAGYAAAIRANPAGARPARTLPGSAARRPCGSGQAAGTAAGGR